MHWETKQHNCSWKNFRVTVLPTMLNESNNAVCLPSVILQPKISDLVYADRTFRHVRMANTSLNFLFELVPYISETSTGLNGSCFPAYLAFDIVPDIETRMTLRKKCNVWVSSYTASSLKYEWRNTSAYGNPLRILKRFTLIKPSGDKETEDQIFKATWLSSAMYRSSMNIKQNSFESQLKYCSIVFVSSLRDLMPFSTLDLDVNEIALR